MHNALERLVLLGTLSVLLLAPTQWGLEVRPKTFVTPSDLLLAVSGLLGLVALLRGRLSQRVSTPSLFAVLFVAFGALSISAAQNRPDAVKELAQWGLYLIVAWTLFRYVLEDARTRGTALLLAILATLAVLSVGTVQFFQTHVPDLRVRALFGNRNVLAGFLALALPFAFAQTLVAANPIAALAGLLVSLWGLCLVLSGAAAMALLLTFLVMATLQGRFAATLTVALVLFVTVVLHPNLPRRGETTDPWLDSVALHDASGQVARRYPDWECALLMTQEHPWRGIGAGNYQSRISSYRRIPTPPGAPEPDTQNLYLVLASSIGVPGVLMFVALLLEGMALADRAARASRRTGAEERALALGAFGALLAFSITAVWHPLLVRGLGLPLVAVLALAHHLNERSSRD